MSERQWYIVDFLQAVQTPAVEEDMHSYNSSYGTVQQLRDATKRLHKRGYIRWGTADGRTVWMRMPWREDPVPYRPNVRAMHPENQLKEMRD